MPYHLAKARNALRSGILKIEESHEILLFLILIKMAGYVEICPPLKKIMVTEHLEETLNAIKTRSWARNAVAKRRQQQWEQSWQALNGEVSFWWFLKSPSIMLILVFLLIILFATFSTSAPKHEEKNLSLPNRVVNNIDEE